jgi:anti-sigma factor ChrR (cupin superfamily)
MTDDVPPAVPLDELLARARRPDVPFQPFRPGVEICRLWGDPAARSAAVLRYQAGARVPRHRHVGVEQVYVLSGSQRDERGTYAAGAHVVNPAGSEHAVESPDGCVVLVVWDRPITFLEPAT